VARIDARLPGPWLVSRRWDLWMFGGPASIAFGLLLWGYLTGGLDEATPPWLFLAAVVFVDVAHVWATTYRVYLDPEERARRPGLYLGIPIAAWVGGVLLHSLSAALFWRALAYLAVFHFVRQQYGWVALYRRRLGEASQLDRRLDDAAIYSATLYPLLYWHAHLPREFAWFLEGDFLPGLPASAATVLLPVHLAISAAWAARQLQLLATGRPVSAGKALIVTTTWATWFVGIVLLDSDFAFTVTNVLVHGVPYIGFTPAPGWPWRGSSSRADGLCTSHPCWPSPSSKNGRGTAPSGTTTPGSSRGPSSCRGRRCWPCWCRCWPYHRLLTTSSTRGSGVSGRANRRSASTSDSGGRAPIPRRKADTLGVSRSCRAARTPSSGDRTMAQVTLRGNPVSTIGDLPAVG